MSKQKVNLYWQVWHGKLKKENTKTKLIFNLDSHQYKSFVKKFKQHTYFC